MVYRSVLELEDLSRILELILKRGRISLSVIDCRHDNVEEEGQEPPKIILRPRVDIHRTSRNSH